MREGRSSQRTNSFSPQHPSSAAGGLIYAPTFLQGSMDGVKEEMTANIIKLVDRQFIALLNSGVHLSSLYVKERGCIHQLNTLNGMGRRQHDIGVTNNDFQLANHPPSTANHLSVHADPHFDAPNGYINGNASSLAHNRPMEHGLIRMIKYISWYY